MASYFFDSSALAKAYRQETGSEIVLAILNETGGQFLISSLTTVEFQSVFAQKVRAGLLTLAEFQLVRRKFGGDMRARRIRVKGTLRRHQRAAENLLVAHAPFRRLKTLDALQLALALELWTRRTIDNFVVADHDLGHVAKLEGVPVIDPEQP
jgi:predicted nucleic acid-binding protein